MSVQTFQVRKIGEKLHGHIKMVTDQEILDVGTSQELVWHHHSLCT